MPFVSCAAGPALQGSVSLQAQIFQLFLHFPQLYWQRERTRQPERCPKAHAKGSSWCHSSFALKKRFVFSRTEAESSQFGHSCGGSQDEDEPGQSVLQRAGSRAPWLSQEFGQEIKALTRGEHVSGEEGEGIDGVMYARGSKTSR